MKMEEIEVYDKEGRVFIRQPNPAENEPDSVIELDPEQVPLLIKWLRNTAAIASVAGR
jgi:hypothetical protein